MITVFGLIIIGILLFAKKGKLNITFKKKAPPKRGSIY